MNMYWYITLGIVLSFVAMMVIYIFDMIEEKKRFYMTMGVLLLVFIRCIIALFTVSSKFNSMSQYESSLNELQPYWVERETTYLSEENREYYGVSIVDIKSIDVSLGAALTYLISPSSVDVSELYDYKVKFDNMMMFRNLDGMLTESKIIGNLRYYFISSSDVAVEIDSDYDKQLHDILKSSEGNPPRVNVTGKFKYVSDYGSSMESHHYEPIDVEISEI